MPRLLLVALAALFFLRCVGEDEGLGAAGGRSDCGALADRPRAIAALTKIFNEIERQLCAATVATSDAATPASALPQLGGLVCEETLAGLQTQ